MAWCLEVRKTSAFSGDGLATASLSVFLRRCPCPGEGSLDAQAAGVLFSIRLLGVPGQLVGHSVVGKAAEAKPFSVGSGEEKWGWHRFMQWQEAIVAEGASDSVCPEDMRFVVVMELR